MAGRWLQSLLVLVAMLAPGQAVWAQALPELPPPPPPKTPPPPPMGIRPMVGTDGRLIMDAQGRPQYVIELPTPPAPGIRPENLPPVIMKHLTPNQPMSLPPVPGTLPLPTGQNLPAAPGVVAPPVIVPRPTNETPSTLPQTSPASSVPVPPPPPTEGGRRPGGPR
ncbi:MAG: hypothetical protein H7338_06080 [Candidatus Sericytochromatia bacterium]|nr:hypothetical protein [Candidatus Sericytochromatia bacterium]